MKNIVVAFSIASRAGQEWLAGIQAYAGQQPEWSLREINESETSSMCRGFDFSETDALICTTSASIPPSIPIHNIASVCIVNSNDPPPQNASLILNDNAAFAEKIASHLLSKRLKHFAFMRFDNFPWAVTRGVSFIRTIQTAGFTVDLFEPDLTATEASDRRRLVSWLKSLPKPCGIMASFDGRARLILEIAREEGIRVPHELCVVGVDNDCSICENTVPTLSSLDPQFFREGWIAAKTLDDLLNGRIKKPVTVINQGGNVMERASSDFLPKIYHVAAVAMEVIKTRCAETLSVEGIAHITGVSRRLLEMRFQEVYGDTIQNKLREVRIERVKSLLRHSSMPIEQICALSGYSNISYLKRTFKTVTGKTMRDFRKSPDNP